MPQDNRAHFPSGDGPYFGRRLSTAYADGVLWTAVQMETAGRNTIAVFRSDGRERKHFVLKEDGFCHQPCIAPASDGGAIVAWNECERDTWHIKRACVDSDFGTTQGAAVGPDLCLPPAVVDRCDETLWAYSTMESGRASVRLTRWLRDTQDTPSVEHRVLSSPTCDAFRPCLAASDDRVYVAWDQYEGQTSKIAVTQLPGLDVQPWTSACDADERGLCPRLVVDHHGTAYVTWLVLRTVTDDLGIVDHFPFAPVLRLRDGQADHLTDESNPTDERIVADFRDGLLASAEHPYRGYSGLRRKPMLSLSGNGQLWCLWEARFGHENTSSAGHLMGRKFEVGSGWTATCILHSGGYAYSVPPNWAGERMPVAFFRTDAEGMDVVQSDFVDATQGQRHEIQHSKWERWNRVEIRPAATPRKAIRLAKKELSLYWTDTHCHSEFSADAEGQVDELIHFAKDVAGLDAVCIVDNDYYPHKALTEAEWRIHQALSAHYTRPGEFVVFPGWEFTYHRHDLDPNFNHRVIMYPGPGWPLFRRIDASARTDGALLRSLERTPAICYPHHCAYEIVDPELERSVEVCSSWRVCLEETDFTIKQLQAGHKLGFIGSSDTHRAVPGLGGALTGVYAEELTPESLFKAYKARRTIATQGHRVLIDFRVGDTFIGEEGEASGHPELSARIEAPEPIEFVELIRDGSCIYRQEPGACECAFEFADRECPAGDHFYFLRVKLVGDPSFNTDPAQNVLGPFVREGPYGHNMARAKGPFAWTSPIWLKVDR